MGWLNTVLVVILGLAIYYIVIRPAIAWVMNTILDKD